MYITVFPAYAIQICDFAVQPLLVGDHTHALGNSTVLVAYRRRHRSARQNPSLHGMQPVLSISDGCFGKGSQINRWKGILPLVYDHLQHFICCRFSGGYLCFLLVWALLHWAQWSQRRSIRINSFSRSVWPKAAEYRQVAPSSCGISPHGRVTLMWDSYRIYLQQQRKCLSSARMSSRWP